MISTRSPEEKNGCEGSFFAASQDQVFKSSTSVSLTIAGCWPKLRISITSRVYRTALLFSSEIETDKKDTEGTRFRDFTPHAPNIFWRLICGKKSRVTGSPQVVPQRSSLLRFCVEQYQFMRCFGENKLPPITCFPASWQGRRRCELRGVLLIKGKAPDFYYPAYAILLQITCGIHSPCKRFVIFNEKGNGLWTSRDSSLLQLTVWCIAAPLRPDRRTKEGLKFSDGAKCGEHWMGEIQTNCNFTSYEKNNKKATPKEKPELTR